MFRGPPLPLPPHVPLAELLAYSRLPGQLGAWVSGCSRWQRIYGTSGARASLLLSPDLGFLLSRCCRVVVREGERPVALEAETVIQWRALQVATATPYLPGFARLQALFPGLQVTTSGFLIPVRKASPEEVLALCAEEGMRVTGSRIVYVGGGKGGKGTPHPEGAIATEGPTQPGSDAAGVGPSLRSG